MRLWTFSLSILNSIRFCNLPLSLSIPSTWMSFIMNHLLSNTQCTMIEPSLLQCDTQVSLSVCAAWRNFPSTGPSIHSCNATSTRLHFILMALSAPVSFPLCEERERRSVQFSITNDIALLPVHRVILLLLSECCSKYKFRFTANASNALWIWHRLSTTLLHSANCFCLMRRARLSFAFLLFLLLLLLTTEWCTLRRERTAKWRKCSFIREAYLVSFTL